MTVQVFWCSLLAVFATAQPAMLRAADDIRYAEIMPLADDSLLLDGIATQSHAILVGEHGHILLSDDLSSWRQAGSVPTRATLTAVEFIGEQGWAVGHDAVILHSTDGGENWTRQFFAPERQQPFMDVYFIDQDRGFAVGAYGLYLTTNDGGETWLEGDLSASDDWHHYAMLKTPRDTLLVAGEMGIVYRSEDRGSSWQAIQLPYEGSMFGLLQTGPERILTFGLRGHAFRSTDEGVTWEPVATGTTHSLFGGRVFDDGTLVLAGNAGVVLIREPRATAFEVYQQEDGEALAGVLRNENNELIVFGVNGVASFDPKGSAP